MWKCHPFSSMLCDIFLHTLPQDIVVQYLRSCAMQVARDTGSNSISSRLDGLLTFLSIQLESLEKSDSKHNRGRALGNMLSPSQFTHVRHGKPTSSRSTVILRVNQKNRTASSARQVNIDQSLKGQEVFPLYNQRTSGTGLHRKDHLHKM